MAAKLRLTAVERDELLLAAGFPPEVASDLHPTDQSVVSSSQTTGIHTPTEFGDQAKVERANSEGIIVGPVQTAREWKQRQRRLWSWFAAASFAVMALLILVLIMTGALQDVIGRTERMRPQPTAPGETLIVIGEFANYSGGQAGYNVAGRLQEALQEQIDQSGLAGVRVAKWPQVIADQASALSASQAMSATLVVWGEYDSGRVPRTCRRETPRAISTAKSCAGKWVHCPN